MHLPHSWKLRDVKPFEVVAYLQTNEFADQSRGACASLVYSAVLIKKFQEKRGLSTEEALVGKGHRGPGSQNSSSVDNSLQGGVHHLSAVAGAASGVEVAHVVSTREGSVRHFLPEELAERAPSVVDVVLQQSLGRHQAAHFSDVVQVNLLALVGEVTPEEGFEKLGQHGIVHASRPADVRGEPVLRISGSPVDSLHHRSVYPYVSI